MLFCIQEFSKFSNLNFSQGPDSAVQEPARFQGLREPDCFARFLNPENKSFTLHLPWTLFSVHGSSFVDPWTKKFICHLPWTMFIVHGSSFGDPWTKKIIADLPWTVLLVGGSSFDDLWTEKFVAHRHRRNCNKDELLCVAVSQMLIGLFLIFSQN